MLKWRWQLRCSKDSPIRMLVNTSAWICVGKHACRASSALCGKTILPAADAAGLARPGLDPRVARLCVERVGVTPRQLGAGGAARFLGVLTRRLDAPCATCGLGAAAFDTTTRSVFTGLRSVLASIRTGANCVSGPSRFGESTAWERSRPRNSPARYSSASAAPPDIRSPVQSAAAIAFFRTITGLLKSTKK